MKTEQWTDRPWVSAAELRRHYASVRQRLDPPPKPKTEVAVQPISEPVSEPEEIVPEPPPLPPPTPFETPSQTIIRIVCTRFGIPRLILMSPVRLKHPVKARHVAYYLVWKHLRLSLPGIGRVFGRNPSTIRHGVIQINHRIKANEQFAARICSLEAEYTAARNHLASPDQKPTPSKRAT